MPENSVFHIAENSPEYVAYTLMRLIGDVEGRANYQSGDNPMDREWILTTYAQCLRTIQAPASARKILAG